MRYTPHNYQTRLKDFIIDNRYAFLTVDMDSARPSLH